MGNKKIFGFPTIFLQLTLLNFFMMSWTVVELPSVNSMYCFPFCQSPCVKTAKTKLSVCFRCCEEISWSTNLSNSWKVNKYEFEIVDKCMNVIWKWSIDKLQEKLSLYVRNLLQDGLTSCLDTQLHVVLEIF